MEHPADRGAHPFASIWILDIVAALLAFSGVHCVTGDQCMWGAAHKKRTTILSNLPGLAVFRWNCTHGGARDPAREERGWALPDGWSAGLP